MEEVDAIRSIPLVHNGGNDQLIWHHSKDGRYSTKNGYWVAVQNSRSAGGAHNPSLIPAEHWKHLWKMKLPPKILHFLWNCSSGTLPCLSALMSRHVVDNSMCPRCQLYPETPLHATFECSTNAVMLERASFYSKLMTGMWDSFHALLSNAGSKWSKDEAGLFCVLLWVNWKERNAIVHGESPRDPSVLYALGLSTWNGIMESSTNHKNGQNGVAGPVLNNDRYRWKPPVSGVLKINCDASVSVHGIPLLSTQFVFIEDNSSIL